MIKNKKGILLYITVFGLVIAFAILFTMAYTRKGPELYKGEQELKLLQVYQDAENALVYVDQSAKYATHKSIPELAEKGGFYAPVCGTYKEYNIWKNNCFPDYKKSIAQIINQNLNPYLVVYAEQKLPPDNYDITILDNAIAGTAKAKLSIYTSGLDRIEYFVSPSFTIEIEHNLNTYEKLIAQARILIQTCSTDDIKSCIEQNLPQAWLFGSCEGDKTIQDRTSRFCFISDNLKYKFALQFPQPE